MLRHKGIHATGLYCRPKNPIFSPLCVIQIVRQKFLQTLDHRDAFASVQCQHWRTQSFLLILQVEVPAPRAEMWQMFVGTCLVYFSANINWVSKPSLPEELWLAAQGNVFQLSHHSRHELVRQSHRCSTREVEERRTELFRVPTAGTCPSRESEGDLTLLYRTLSLPLHSLERSKNYWKLGTGKDPMLRYLVVLLTQNDQMIFAAFRG